MIAMGQAIVQRALHCAQHTAVMIGVAGNAIVLVGIAGEGHHNVAPAIVLGSVVQGRSTTAARPSGRDVATKAAQHVQIIHHGVGGQCCLSTAAINMGRQRL